MADLTLPRETGLEQAEARCARCNGVVPMVETSYGSTAPGACPICWPAAADSQLEAQTAAAEVVEEDDVPEHDNDLDALPYDDEDDE